MRPPPKPRIATQAAENSRPGLNAAFADLQTPGLPAKPADTEPAPVPLATWKMGRVVLRRETARRGGKTVIVVDDFASHLPLTVIERVARQLRQTCGCGGTVRGRVVEIQGDQPAKIRAWLEAEGFQVAGIR